MASQAFVEELRKKLDELFPDALVITGPDMIRLGIFDSRAAFNTAVEKGLIQICRTSGARRVIFKEELIRFVCENLSQKPTPTKKKIRKKELNGNHKLQSNRQGLSLGQVRCENP